MESVLETMGVQQDAETDILARILGGAKSDGANATRTSSRPNISSLANAVLENEQIANQFEGVVEVESLLDSTSTIGNKRKRGKELKAKILTDREELGGDYPSIPLSTSRKKVDTKILNTLVMSVSKKRKSAVQQEEEEEALICPSCNRSLSGFTNHAAEQHISWCEDRYDPTEHEEVKTTSDDNNEKDYQPNIRLTRRKRNKPDTDEAKEEVDNDADSNTLEGMSSSPVDDWEDDDYLTRSQNLSLEQQQTMETPFATKVTQRAWEKLYDYQRDGCKWLHSLFTEGVGGILADEMGLGKTAQTCVHFGSLGRMNTLLNSTRQAMFLIVSPATVLVHWLKEMRHWAPLVRTGIFHTISTTGSALNSLTPQDLTKVLKTLRNSKLSSGVAIITTYDTLRKHVGVLEIIEWTAICLDEGQKIRNPNTAIAMACKQLPAFHRLILSGTPIQNSLVELWSLFDFIYPGRLGSLQVFDEQFAYPIRAGAYAHASKLQYEVAIRCAATLQRIVRPYLLRRKKDELALTAQLPAKTEQILFCPISSQQRMLYLQVIESEEVKNVIAKKTAAFRALMMLRKLCNHPALVYRQGELCWSAGQEVQDTKNRLQTLKQQQSQQPIAAIEEGEVKLDDDEDDPLRELLTKEGSGSISWAESGKLLVLSKILPIWQQEGHKVLIFCQTTSMLSLIEAMVLEMKLTYLRMDGMTAISKRTELIDRYNRNDDIFAMLLTTRTGGLGISLTSANRVILFDPDWNPMTDIQARERAWRLGQKREVVIYRLISRGTIEEKIYQRQIFKLLLSSRVLEDTKQKSIFSKSQIRELFELTENEHVYGPVDYGHGHDELPSGGVVDVVTVSSSSTQPLQQQAQQLQAATAQEEGELFTIVPVSTLATYNNEVEEAINNDNEDGNKDRLLLKALFEGEAITSVYDHDYLEPGVRNGDEKVANQASRIANRAYASLQSSAAAYCGSNPVPLSATNAQSTSSSSSNQQRTVTAAEVLFGTQTAAPDSNRSSSALLAAIRAQQQPVSAPQPQPSSSSSTAAAAASSLEDNIRNRLRTLFQSSATRPVTTQVIINQFRDLGHQYSPLFKQILRSMATPTNGVWTLK